MADITEFDLKKEKARGYSLGYAAAKKTASLKRKELDDYKRDTARHDRFMCAAITGLLANGTPWGKEVNGKWEKSDGCDGYAQTAKHIADSMLKKARQ